MQNLIQKGLTLRYKNSGSQVIPGGSLVVLPACVGVAVFDIAPGEEGVLNMSGVYSLPKAAGAIAQGVKVYASASGQISTDTGDTPAGIAWDASSGDTVNVSINV